MVRKSRKGREEWKIYKNVFDAFTERQIFSLSTRGYFKELETPLALGKEANIFLARTKEDEHIIVKIYRLENCNFNKMYSYINSDPRFTGLENQKRKIIFSWVQREFRNLMLAREKIKVPKPIAFKDNIILMEYIGDDEAAPQLKNLKPQNPEEFLNKIITNIKLLVDAGLVHGDLSNFNILNDKEEPIFIDFSQATPIKAQNAKELLKRDVKNILKQFSRIAKYDTAKITEDILKHYDKKVAEEKKQ